ncbi:ABC transporter permease [Mycobacterium sp. BMJ-28]
MILDSETPTIVTPAGVAISPTPLGNNLSGENGRQPRYRGWSGWVLGNVGLLVSILVVSVVIGWALLPELFTRRDPLRAEPRNRLQPPSGEHWFGTDNLGRDIYARVVHGASLSLQATLVAVLIALIAGSMIGLAAGYVGGTLDAAVMRGVDVLLAIPGLLLSLMVVTVLGFGTLNVAIAVGVAAAGTFARVMRSEVVRVRSWAFVEASAGLGSRWYKVLFRRILPNAAGSVLSLAALEFGSAILSVAALSFLGFGAQPPAPEWGQMIAEGRNFLAAGWWLTTLPGLVVVLVVVSGNRIGHAIEGDRR